MKVATLAKLLCLHYKSQDSCYLPASFFSLHRLI